MLTSSCLPPRWVSVFPGGREETSCEQDTDLCPLLGCVLVCVCVGGGFFLLRALLLLYLPQNIPQIPPFPPQLL